MIDAVDANEAEETPFDKAVEVLIDDAGFLLEEIFDLREHIPASGGTQEEEEALCETDRRIQELKQKRRQKLDELGCDSPAD